MATNSIPRRNTRASKTTGIPGKEGPKSDLFDEHGADCLIYDPTVPGLRSAPPPGSGLPAVDAWLRACADEVARDMPGAPGAVVLPSVGGTATADGRRVAQEFSSLIGARLPLVPVPDLGRVRLELGRSYPHAAPVLDGVLGRTAARDHVAMRPTLLVGSPGCGKTSFAQALLAGLGVRCLTYPCGGAACTALAGAPRRWSTGEPSVPASLFAAHRVASPGIVLDELEKVATGKTNGSLHDGLLGMIEPTTRAAWLDPYCRFRRKPDSDSDRSRTALRGATRVEVDDLMTGSVVLRAGGTRCQPRDCRCGKCERFYG